MSYLDKQVSGDERVVYVARPHLVVFLGSAARAILLLIAMVTAALALWYYDAVLPAEARAAVHWGSVAIMALPLVVIAARYLRWRTTQYVVTNRKTLRISGIFSKDIYTSSLDHINELRIKQPMLGRILGYGHVSVLTGSDEERNPQDEEYRFVARPQQFLAVLDEQREARRLVPAKGLPGSRGRRDETADGPGEK